MILAYAFNIRMNGVFKPNGIKYEVEQKMISDKNYIYVHAYLLNRLQQRGQRRGIKFCARQIGTHLLFCLGDDFMSLLASRLAFSFFLFDMRRPCGYLGIFPAPPVQRRLWRNFPKFKGVSEIIEVKTIQEFLNELYLYKYLNINKIKTKRGRAVRVLKP